MTRRTSAPFPSNGVIAPVVLIGVAAATLNSAQFCWLLCKDARFVRPGASPHGGHLLRSRAL